MDTDNTRSSPASQFGETSGTLGQFVNVADGHFRDGFQSASADAGESRFDARGGDSHS